MDPKFNLICILNEGLSCIKLTLQNQIQSYHSLIIPYDSSSSCCSDFLIFSRKQFYLQLEFVKSSHLLKIGFQFFDSEKNRFSSQKNCNVFETEKPATLSSSNRMIPIYQRPL